MINIKDFTMLTNLKEINILENEEKIKIESFNFNSKNLIGNSVFIALKGGNVDGHVYIQDAINKGAKICIIEDYKKEYDKYLNKVKFLISEDTMKDLKNIAIEYRKKILKECKIISITGSNGKTTTKDILYTILNISNKVHKTNGNFNNHIGVPLTILNTPSDSEYLVLEIGMNHFNEIKELSKIAEPDYAIITNIGESHVENLGSRDGIVKAKMEIIEGMDENSIILLPSDSDKIEELKKENKKIKNVLLFGKKEDNYESYKIKQKLLEKTIFESKLYNTEFEFSLFGNHNVSNASACIAISKLENISKEDIEIGLKNIGISKMRFEKIETTKNYTLINDAYNASPTSMKASIETFINLYKNKNKILVIGDMFELGQESLSLHKEIGTYLNNCEFELLVTIGENTKQTSYSYKGNKRHFETKEEAVEWLKLFDDEKYALFFKASRGMKLEKLIDDIK